MLVFLRLFYVIIHVHIFYFCKYYFFYAEASVDISFEGEQTPQLFLLPLTELQ